MIGCPIASLAFAEPLQLRRIAFSLVGPEHGAFTSADAADVLLDVLTAVEPSGSGPELIVIATANSNETSAVTGALAARRARVT